MSFEKVIEKHYNGQIDKYKNDIIDVLCEILGEKYRELITCKINSYGILYYVDRERLEKSLAIDELEDIEREVIKYFLDKLDNYTDIKSKSNEELLKMLEETSENVFLPPKIKQNIKETLEIVSSSMACDKDFLNKARANLISFCEIISSFDLIPKIIGSYGINPLTDNVQFNYLDLNNKSFLFKYHGEEQYVNAIPIYTTVNWGFYYIFWLLNYIGHKNNSKYFTPIEELNLKTGIENFEDRIYTRIIGYITIMVLKKLQQKYINFLCNKSLDKINYSLLEDGTLKEFFEYFGDLIPIFLFNPALFIEIVGKDNFIDFASYILKENLDVNIDDVLEKMILTRLENNMDYIINMDIPAISTTFNKLKEERQEKKLYGISRFIRYIEKYGNAIVYFNTNRSDISYAVTFIVDNLGNIKAFGNYEIFDKTYFDRTSTDVSTSLKETMHIADYNDEDLVPLIASIIYNSLYGDIKIMHGLKQEKINTQIATSKLYFIASSALELDTNNFIMWVKSSRNGCINLLTNKALKSNMSPDDISECSKKIESEMQTFYKKLQEVKFCWDNMQNARNEEEYQEEAKTWDTLCKK